MPNLNNINRKYLDDFNEDKNFYKILYRPGYAVQARELNQQQAILQNQVKKFGEHVFKDGSIVLGGSFDAQERVSYVKITNFSSPDIPFINSDVRGVNSGVKAKIIHHAADTNNHIIYVQYTQSGVDHDKFIQDERLIITSNDIEYAVNVVDAEDCVGTGSLFSISEGTLFYNGYFINFPKQTTVVSKYEQVKDAQIVFKAEFFTVTSFDDESLFDNAQGSPNFNAPGADRLSAELTLEVHELQEELDDNYITLMEFRDGKMVTDRERTEYSRIAEELAKRTYDESGDYVVRGMTVFSREHLDNGDNGGRFTLDKGGDSNLISIGVERGLAYVKGFEIRTNETKYVDIPKSTEYKNVNNQISTVRGSNYFLVNQVSGTPRVNEFQVVELFDQSENRHDNAVSYLAPAQGTKIGTAIIRTVTTEMTGAKQWLRVYVMSINIDQNRSLDEVRFIQTPNFSGDVVVRQDGSTLRSPSSQSLLISTSESATRSVRSENGQSDTSFSFSRTTDVVTNNDGEFTISTPQSSETIPYGIGTLFDITKNRIVVSVRDDISVSAPGTISCSDSTVIGSGTNFTTQFTVGERFHTNSDTSTYYTIKEIVSDTELEIHGTGSFDDATFSKYYMIGDIIRLSGYGINGARTVVSDVNSIEISLNEPFGENVPLSVTYDVSINEAEERKKALKPNRVVKIDLSNVDSIYRINLGFCDVHRIRSIRWSENPFTNSSDGVDVTKEYTLNNGQTDLYYDHSYLVANSSKYTSGHLLVTLDYFEGSTSGGIGYYSIDSYPINDENPSDSELMTINIPRFRSSVDGNLYNLRNFLDFRPSKQNTASDTTSVSSASVNPPKTDSFVTGPNVLAPTPGTQVTFDYSFYVSRKDVIVMNQDGELSAVLGTPAAWPYFPSVSSDYMGVCQVYVPPFPSIAGTHARMLGKTSKGVQTTRVTHKRYTMRDIGRLDSRIKTLEYYNALSLLEKSASDMTIPDENGLDRFKNGFFVDGYMDHSLGQQNNPDYKIAVDRENQLIRPVFEMNAFKLKLGLGNHYYENNDFVTLPWTETSLLEQKRVTTYRNIEQSVFRFIGVMEIDPPIDTWVDETVTDKTIERNDLEDDFGITLPEGTSTEWKTWQTSSTSTTVNGSYSAYDRAFGDRSQTIAENAPLIGHYSSYNEARSAARSYDRRTKIAINEETVTTDTTKDWRKRIDTTVNVDRETEEIGNFLTDVAITPYIRPQRIEVFVKGLKANTIFHIWFDGENMNDYFNQYTLPSDGDKENATRGTEGAEIRSNEYGEVYGFLRLPENGKRFRIGTKKIRITDSPTNSVDATSYAEKNFVASGLETKKQNTIYSTIVDASVDVKEGKKELVGTESTSSSRTKQRVEILGPSCMAYSFLVDVPEGEPGVFLTSVDVFIQALHPELGVWFEIREMSSDGGITRTQVPYSEVWMYRDDPRLKVSNDASVPTNVNFKNPVFLMNNTQYAFVIHTEGLNPDTYFFVSRLGEEDLNTGEQVTGRQLTGTTYTTNNNLNWDIVPDVDLTVRFNRAKFDNSTDGEFNFILGDYELIKTDTLSDYFVSPGDEIVSSDSFNISNVSGEPIEEGDTIIGQSSGASGKVIKIGDSSKLYTDGFGFSNNEVAEIEEKGITFTINNLNRGKAKVYKVNRVTNKLILDKSNGQFFEGAKLKTDDGVEFPLIEFYDFPYHLINFDAGTLPFKDTDAKFKLETVLDSNRNSVLSELELGESVDHEFDNLMVIDSRTVEKQDHSGRKSVTLKTKFSSASEYVSPVFDVTVMRAIFVQNVINDDITGEENPSGGNLTNKYISKTIILDEGQTAEDLNTYLSVYRPPNSNIYVWARFKNNEDQESISTKDWIRLEQSGSGFSSRSNDEDYLEFEYHIPKEYMTGEFGEFQYTSSDGHVHTGFDSFEIKVGLAGTDKLIVPKVSDLRAIALMV